MTTILVGVDPSERSLDAIAFARALAGASGAMVLVANVFLDVDDLGQASKREYGRALEREAQRTARRMADELGSLGGERVATAAVAGASPADGLQQLAEERGAALVVVGSSRVGAVGRVLPGSTGERLLRHAPCPVAVVPNGYRTAEHDIRRVGVAYDGSPTADAAVRGAVEIARATAAELRVVRVVDMLEFGAPAMTGLRSYMRARTDIERHAREHLDDTVRRLPDDIAIEAKLLAGDPARELAVQSGTLDLLVTGTRRHRPLGAVLLGAVTGRLLRQAACPVLVVPRGVRASFTDLFATPAEAARR
jgi:nucleotide-binding universal stress UspA family protein